LGGLLISAPLGVYVARVWTSGDEGGGLALWPVERAVWRLLAIDPSRRQGPLAYALSLIGFNAAGFLSLYLVLRLPINWMLGLPFAHGLSPDLAFVVAFSSLGGCAPETVVPGGAIDLSVDMISQVLGLSFAATTSLCLTGVLARGFAARGGRIEIGNFWTDAVRNLIHVVAPLVALLLLLWPLLISAAMLASFPNTPPSPPGAWTLGTAVIPDLISNTIRFSGAIALGRLARVSAEGRLLAIVMAVIALPLAWIAESHLIVPGRPSSASLLMTLARATLASSLEAGAESIIVMAILASCLGAMLIGRAPEYLGKRLDRRTITLSLTASLALWAALVGLAGLLAFTPAALSSLAGGHWAWAAPTRAYANTAVGLTLAIGRFGAVAPIITLAGALWPRPRRALTAGALSTDGAGFATLLTVLILATGAIRGLPWLLSPSGLGGAARLIIARGPADPGTENTLNTRIGHPRPSAARTRPQAAAPWARGT
jgi:K+-transporting ATPase A subunit